MDMCGVGAGGGCRQKEWGAEKGSVFLPITKEFISWELGQRMRGVSFQAFTPTIPPSKPTHPALSRDGVGSVICSEAPIKTRLALGRGTDSRAAGQFWEAKLR